MTQEQMLSLILDKVVNIESDVSNLKKDMEEVKSDVSSLKKDMKEVKSAQNNIREFIMNVEQTMVAYDENQKMLERIKIAVNS